MKGKNTIGRHLLKRLIKRLSPLLQRFWQAYSQDEHQFRYKNKRFRLAKGVFHPTFFLSTRIFIEFLQNLDLRQKRVWELGAGSGLISMVCADKGARVLATDLNPSAVGGLLHNIRQQQLVQIEVLQSDLFDQVPPQTFDYILLNPPYYPQNPQNEAEAAFFCGDSFQYFERLFAGLQAFIHEQSFVYMILSEDCNLSAIGEIAHKHGWQMQLVYEKVKWGEWNGIWQILR